MAEQNIADVTKIYGRTTVVSDLTSSSATSVLTTSTNQIVKVNTVMAANKTTSTVTVSLLYNNSAYIAYDISIPPGSSIALVGKDTPIYVEESETLTAVAGTATAVDLVISYEVIETS